MADVIDLTDASDPDIGGMPLRQPKNRAARGEVSSLYESQDHCGDVEDIPTETRRPRARGKSAPGKKSFHNIRDCKRIFDGHLTSTPSCAPSPPPSTRSPSLGSECCEIQVFLFPPPHYS